MKRALILDLDNTIYPVSSIADNLFAELFKTLDNYAELINADDKDKLNKIKQEMMRRPFHHIAEEYGLSDEITKSMVDVLKNMTYDLPMQPFEDYAHIRSIPLDKFLVTTGFVKLQNSKVRMLGIEDDFKAIHIVDPEASNQTKKEAFAEIMQKHNYAPEELLVIGDDPQSEIKAATALGIDTFLFDPENRYPDAIATHKADNLKQVLTISI
jgi:putative hydrolase of the HAD superfamily